MSKSRMKAEVSVRLKQAQERWFALKERGESKHSLKVRGLRERRDMHYFLRPLIFTGGTRVAYEREIKRFIDFAHDVRRRRSNQEVAHKDFRAYVEQRLKDGVAANYLNKIKSAIVKFGAVYGKSDSFAAMSRKIGRQIREYRESGRLSPPHRPRVTAKVRESTIDRLRELDLRHEARSGSPRGYYLALRLQKEAALRAVEATDRFSKECLVGIDGDRGQILIVGKGGRLRTVEISAGLHRDLAQFFRENPSGSLASLGAYRSAYRRAILYVGGRSTGTHAQRRVSAQEHKDAEYWKELNSGLVSAEASRKAKQAAVERLGHSRMREDVVKAYLR